MRVQIISPSHILSPIWKKFFSSFSSISFLRPRGIFFLIHKWKKDPSLKENECLIEEEKELEIKISYPISLSSKGILLLRPLDSALSFGYQVEEKLKKKVFPFPILSFSLIKRDLSFLEGERFSYILFSSPRAVYAFKENLVSSWGLPGFYRWVKEKSPVFISIGEETAKTLQKELFLSSISPPHFSQEGLIQMFHGKNIEGKSFLFLRTYGREIFKDFLEEKGAFYRELILYDMKEEEKEKLSLYWEDISSYIEAIFVGSGKFWDFFLKFLKERKELSFLEGKKIYAIGEATAKKIKEQGFFPYFPSNSSREALLELLA